MSAHQRTLDLERYRRMKQKSRLSPRFASPNALPNVTDFTGKEILIVPSPSASSSLRSPSPISSTLSSSILNGMLGSHESASSYTTPKLEELKRKRLEKFRARTRLSGAESPLPHREVIDTFSPSTPKTPKNYQEKSLRSDPDGIGPVEGSPLKPIVCDDDIPLPHSASMSSLSIPSPPGHGAQTRPRSLGSSFSRRAYNKQKEQRHFFGSHSPSPTRRHGVEESRDNKSHRREPFSEIRAAPDRDRIEATREEVSVPTSLGIPSLHSQLSSETSGQQIVEDISKRKNYQFTNIPIQTSNSVPSGTEPIQGNGALSFRRRFQSSSRPRSIPTSDRIETSRTEDSASARPEIDQRTVRLLYAKQFARIIADEKEKETYSESQNENKYPLSRDTNGVYFVARKRPITQEDVERGDFDVVDIDSNDPTLIKVYDAKIQPDLKTKHVTPLIFRCGTAFAEDCSAEEFYIRVGQPLALAAKAGGMATMVMFGQFGSSMDCIEERVVYDLFESAFSRKKIAQSNHSIVSVQSVELCGNQCYDLLGTPGSSVRVVEKEGGYFKFKGALSKTASNAKELLKILSDAKRRRVAVDTVRNQASIILQSQVLCNFSIRQNEVLGSLTLLECSGADRDFGDHWKDNTDSNSQALFECLRARISRKPGRKADAPYCTSNLTKFLMETFERVDSRICLVANLSPNATETESTVGFLSKLSKIFDSREKKSKESCLEGDTPSDDLTLPRQWSHSELVSWLKKKRLLGNPVPADVNGKFTMRMSKMQLKNTFYNVMDDAKAERLFASLRAEHDRVARLRLRRKIARDRHEITC